jgi:hypothetical protein
MSRTVVAATAAMHRQPAMFSACLQPLERRRQQPERIRRDDAELLWERRKARSPYLPSDHFDGNHGAAAFPDRIHSCSGRAAGFAPSGAPTKATLSRLQTLEQRRHQQQHECGGQKPERIRRGDTGMPGFCRSGFSREARIFSAIASIAIMALSAAFFGLREFPHRMRCGLRGLRRSYKSGVAAITGF